VLHAVARHTRELDVYESALKAGEWPFRKPRARDEFPVGVLGLGVLGTQVARALQGLGYPVLGWSQTPKTVTGVRCHDGPEGLQEFLAATRILVCLLPLTPQTENILNAANLGRLRPGGYLINVARGGHVVDADLVAALDSGQLAGAMLDVFRTEPLPQGHPFWQHPKITMTPHISARTLRGESLAQIAGKILAMERGEAISGVVDRRRGY
jgi:glyoxylate/hydroxypyruvate reductase